jgi:hypothetical protein
VKGWVAEHEGRPELVSLPTRDSELTRGACPLGRRVKRMVVWNDRTIPEIEVTGAQRPQEHERPPLPHSGVAGLQFSDLHCTHAANTVGQFDEKRPRQTTSLKVVSEGSPHDFARWQSPERGRLGGRARPFAPAAQRGPFPRGARCARGVGPLCGATGPPWRSISARPRSV